MDVNGIVIKNRDVGDSDKLVTIATPQGLLTAKAKGVKKASSKLKSFVGVLSFGEFSVAESKAGFVLNGANVTESFYNCWSDPDRYAAAMLCLEIFEKCNARVRIFPASDGEIVGFIDLLKTLSDVNYGEFYPPAFALKYGVSVAVSMGLDVTGDVFPDGVKELFLAIYNSSDPTAVLADYNNATVKNLLMHLAAGFKADLNVDLTVASEIFRM